MPRTRRPRRISIQVLGSSEDHGHVRLNDFIKQLDVVRNALRQTERLLTGSDAAGVYWRVVDLRHNSPATVVLEEVHKPSADSSIERLANDPRVIDEFISTLAALAKKPQLPQSKLRDLSVLESYRDLTQADGRIERVALRVGKKSVVLGEKFRRNVDEVIGPDEVAFGSISGVLEALNIHNTLRFNVYPLVGPKKVVCSFTSDMKPEVIGAIDKYVNVSGTLKYKHWSDFPHAMEAQDIHVFSTEAASLESLRGIAQGATGTQASEDFVEALRDVGW